MFPVENHQSKINIDVAAFIKNRHLFNQGRLLNFSLFRDYLATQNRDDLEYHYTHGLCGVLATVLHQLLGWSVVGIAINGEYIHMGVENPDTFLYTDARGKELSDQAFYGRFKSYHGAYCSIHTAYTIDHFIPDAHKQYYYPMCLLEHVPVLLPQFKPLVKQIESRYTEKAEGE